MTRKLVYTRDSIGEYTIADETEKWVTIVGQVETESDAKLFSAAPGLLKVATVTLDEIGHWLSEQKPELRQKLVSAINKATGETK